MEYTDLGDSGLRVSRLAFGCEALGGTNRFKIDDKESIAAVHRALDLGINFFDTADVYGLGRSEEILSKALGARRHEVVIATKFGVNWAPNPGGGRAQTFRDSSPKWVVEALENSLRRLRIDSIPLYHIHWPDFNVPIADTMEALVDCQKQGKVQHIGCSNFTDELLVEANQVKQITSLEAPYNLGNRSIEDSLIDCCMQFGTAVLAYGPLSQGMLTGKYDKVNKFTGDDRLSQFHGDEFERHLRIVDRLKETGIRCGKSPAQLAIRWVLENPSISAVIVGLRRPEHVDENIGALGWNLDREDRDYLQTDA